MPDDDRVTCTPGATWEIGAVGDGRVMMIMIGLLV